MYDPLRVINILQLREPLGVRRIIFLVRDSGVIRAVNIVDWHIQRQYAVSSCARYTHVTDHIP